MSPASSLRIRSVHVDARGRSALRPGQFGRAIPWRRPLDPACLPGGAVDYSH